MQQPKILAYVVQTGRALVEFDDFIAWMSADDALEMSEGWRKIHQEILERDNAVESVL